MTAAEYIKTIVFKGGLYMWPAGMAELADARDLKSRSRKGVRVRPPLPAVKELKCNVRIQEPAGETGFSTFYIEG